MSTCTENVKVAIEKRVHELLREAPALTTEQVQAAVLLLRRTAPRPSVAGTRGPGGGPNSEDEGRYAA